MSVSVNLPLHHEDQKCSSGTGSPGWSRKRAVKWLWCGCGNSTKSLGYKTIVLSVCSDMERMRCMVAVVCCRLEVAAACTVQLVRSESLVLSSTKSSWQRMGPTSRLCFVRMCSRTQSLCFTSLHLFLTLNEHRRIKVVTAGRQTVVFELFATTF